MFSFENIYHIQQLCILVSLDGVNKNCITVKILKTLCEFIKSAIIRLFLLKSGTVV